MKMASWWFGKAYLMAMATGTMGQRMLTVREARLEERRMIWIKRIGLKPRLPDSPEWRTVRMSVNHAARVRRGGGEVTSMLETGSAREAVDGEVVFGGFSAEVASWGAEDSPGRRTVGDWRAGGLPFGGEGVDMVMVVGMMLSCRPGGEDREKVKAAVPRALPPNQLPLGSRPASSQTETSLQLTAG